MLNYLNSAVTVAETKDACVLCRRVFKDQDEKSSRLAEVAAALCCDPIQSAYIPVAT